MPVSIGDRARGIFRAARGTAAVYLAAAVLSRAGAILLIPLYTRRLAPADYGDFALAQTIVSLLPTLLTLGLLGAIPRFYYDVEDKAEARRQAGALAKGMLGVVLLSTGLFGVGVAVFGPSGSGGVFHRWELACVLVACAGTVVGQLPEVYFRISQRPIASAGFMLTQFVVTIAAGLSLVAVLGRGLRGAIEALAVTGASGAVAGSLFTFFYLRGTLSRALLRKAMTFSVPLIPHLGAMWFQTVADRWVIKAFGFDVQLGPYVLAAQLVIPVAMVVGAWNDAESPRLGEVFRTGGLVGLQSVMRPTYRGYVVAAVVPGLFLMLSLPLVKLFVGSRFDSTLTYMPFFWAITVVETLYYPAGQIVYYASRTRLVSGVTILGGLANVLLSVALVPVFGVGGALVARLLAAAIRSGAIVLAARKCVAAARAGEIPST